MSTRPEALRLADELITTLFESTRWEAAAELRRLHARNQELLKALKELSAEECRDDDDPVLKRARIKARAAIAKVEGQV